MTSMTTTTATTTTTTTPPTSVPMVKRRRKQDNNGNWEKEFYKNGYPTEVIVIEDSPTPPPHASNQQQPHQQQQQQQQQHHLDYRYHNHGSSSSSYSSSSSLPLNSIMPPNSSCTSSSTGSAYNSPPNHHNQHINHHGNGINMSYSSSLPRPPALYPTTTSATGLPSTQSYAAAFPTSAATATTTSNTGANYFPSSNKRAFPQQQQQQNQDDGLYSANKRNKKDTSSSRLDHAGHYSTLPTNTTTATTATTTTTMNQQQPLTESYDDKDGHYIIKLNDSLTARYKIMRLLGQGTFGKVVECYDRVRRTFCAVKVIRAIPKYRDASKIEIRVLNTLREHDPLNLNKCIHLLEWFDYRNHICMVFELLGQSVFDFLKSNHFKPFPSSHIQQFAKQLFTSVAFLHDLKLIHTDLKPENILLVNPISHYGTNNGNKQSLILEDTEIRLIDFGSATFERDYHSSVVSTRHYRAPEIILGMGWSYPCDVWSIGCILVEFFTGDALFHTHDNLEHLAMMEAVIGSIPPYIIRQANRDGQKFFKDNKLKYPDTKTSRQSRQSVRNMKPINQLIRPTNPLNAEFMDLIQKLLTYDPYTRISAREALRHPFFTV